MNNTNEQIKEILGNRINLAGDFLARMGHKEGLFQYSYHTITQQFSEDNNIIRQLATLWIFCKWVRSYKKEQYLPFCYKSLQTAYTGYKNNFLLKEVTIAHLAFILLATLQTQKTKEIESFQYELVQKLLKQQNDDGSFDTILGIKDIQYGINYYPCEALLALKEFNSKESKEAVEKSYTFYLEHFKKEKNISIIPWFTQVYGSKKSKDMLDYLISQQNPDGSFGDVGGSGTCAYAEALSAGNRIEEAVKALEFCCKIQCLDQNNFGYGGIFKNIYNFDLRIDATQHFINACLMTMGIL